jgi:hypothetical protein
MMLIEAAYPKRLATPRRRTIETEETSAPADSTTSPSLVVRFARTLQTPGFVEVTGGALYLVAAPCA